MYHKTENDVSNVIAPFYFIVLKVCHSAFNFIGFIASMKSVEIGSVAEYYSYLSVDQNV